MVSTVTSFALSLVQEGLITPDAKRSIILLHTACNSEMDKCTSLLDAVKEQVRIDTAKIETFLTIILFCRGPALFFYADMMITTGSMHDLCVKSVVYIL